MMIATLKVCMCVHVYTAAYSENAELSLIPRNHIMWATVEKISSMHSKISSLHAEMCMLYNFSSQVWLCSLFTLLYRSYII